jgi:hypothetical protein
MNRNEAKELARSLLLPTGALGDLVTRGPEWPPPDQCRDYKRAVGHVMGNAYLLLNPIWQEHPDLNPASKSNSDPLGFAACPHPAETSPKGMLPYLEEAHRVLPEIVRRMIADPSIGKYKSFIEDSAKDLHDAIIHAKQVFA